MRFFVLVLLISAIAAVRVSAQSEASPAVTIALTPQAAGADTLRQVQIRGLTPGATRAGVVIDPGGGETPLALHADSSGEVSFTLHPSTAAWSVGLYRIVVDTGDGRSANSIFAVTDGQPHLKQAETLPSPFSAFNVEGTGLPPNTTVDLTLYLAGMLGQRTYHPTTDASGSLVLFIWPQQFGSTFFSAGTYRIVAPTLHLETDWVVREHPVSSKILVAGTVDPAIGTDSGFVSYLPHRLVWVVYAREDGSPEGEFLVGPTDVRGSADAHLEFPPLAAGTYLMATPYDWGETEFTVPLPTPTNTPTATPQRTTTSTATTTATPRPCFLNVRLSHSSVKVGARQTVKVSTVPSSEVDITVRFPSRNKKHRTGAADNNGKFAWSYTQPGNRTTRTNSSAIVVTKAVCGDGSLKKFSTKYTIH